MRLYLSLATLAVLQVLCFLLLSHLEPEFFLLYFYQTIVYQRGRKAPAFRPGI